MIKKLLYLIIFFIVNIISVFYIFSLNIKKDNSKNFKKFLEININKININYSKREDIINILGNPLKYKGSQICQIEGENFQLYPQNYWMIYPDEFKIHISNNYLDYLQLNINGFELKNKVKIGMNIEQVFKIIDKPDQIIKENVGSQMIKSTLYEFYENNVKKNIFIELKTNYEYHFKKNILKSIYIYNDINHFADFCKSLQEKLNNININNTKLVDLLKILGEPISFEWIDGVFTFDNLPGKYLITYPGVLHFLMENENIKDIRIFGDYYSTSSGIKIGMNLKDVFKIYGNPNKIVELAEYNELISDNVLYKDIENNIGHHYWKLNDIVIWFSNNKIHSIILLSK